MGVHVGGCGAFDRKRTGSQAPLVDPRVDLCPLLLQTLDPGIELGDLALEVLNLFGVGAHSFIEGAGEQVRHGLRLLGHAGAHASIHAGVHGRHGIVSRAGHGPRSRVVSVLGRGGARIHARVLVERDLIVSGWVGDGGGRVAARRGRTVVLFKALGVLRRGVGFLKIGVCAGAAFEEHAEEEAREEGMGVGSGRQKDLSGRGRGWCRVTLVSDAKGKGLALFLGGGWQVGLGPTEIIEEVSRRDGAALMV